MAPDSRIGPAAIPGRSKDSPPPSRSSASTIPPGASAGRECSWCRGPLPPRRRRFCSDPCRARQQKAERVIEDADYAAGVKRLVRAQGKRAGADLVMFAMFAESVDYARARLQDAADQLIAQGYSWGDIGRVLGITRQGARQRFARQQEVVTGTVGRGA